MLGAPETPAISAWSTVACRDRRERDPAAGRRPLVMLPLAPVGRA
jgi:hypothetical protein